MRIIPITIITAVLFVLLKVVDISNSTDEMSKGLIISNVEAQQADENKKKSKKEGSDDEESEEDKDANPAVSFEIDGQMDRLYSESELDLLKKLSNRRRELARWERNIQIKEEVLNATEKRINDQIIKIDSMRQQVAILLEEYNKKEDKKIRSLVRIYENMKPKDAARIFDKVEMPILLLIIDKMSEKKAAPLLAQMDPRRAKQITVELAEKRRYNTGKMGSTAAAPKAKP